MHGLFKLTAFVFRWNRILKKNPKRFIIIGYKTSINFSVITNTHTSTRTEISEYNYPLFRQLFCTLSWTIHLPSLSRLVRPRPQLFQQCTVTVCIVPGGRVRPLPAGGPSLSTVQTRHGRSAAAQVTTFIYYLAFNKCMYTLRSSYNSRYLYCNGHFVCFFIICLYTWSMDYN